MMNAAHIQPELKEQQKRLPFRDRLWFKNIAATLGCVAGISIITGACIIDARKVREEEQASRAFDDSKKAILALTGSVIVVGDAPDDAFVLSFTEKDAYAVQVRAPDPAQGRSLLEDAQDSLNDSSHNQAAADQISNLLSSEDIQTGDVVNVVNAIDTDLTNREVMTRAESAASLLLVPASVTLLFVGLRRRDE